MVDVKECEFYLNGDCTLIDNCLGAKRPFVDKTNPYCSCYKDCYYKQLQQAFEENKRLDSMLGKLNEELLKIVEPRMSDFTGYDEKTNSFDIVLAIKEIIEELEETIASKEVAIERLLNPESEDEE